MASRGKHTAQHSAVRPRQRSRVSGGAHSAGGAHSVDGRRRSAGGHRASGTRRSAGGAHSAAGSHYRRPTKRLRRKRLAAAVASVAVLALLVAGVASFVAQPSAEQAPDASAQQQSSQAASSAASDDPATEYAHVVSLVNQANRTVVPLSKLVSKTVTDGVAKRMDEVLEGQSSAGALLDEASSRLSALTPKLADGTERESASTLSDAIAARKDMLAYGCVILKASSGAHKATDQVVSTWQNFLRGHDDLQTASDHVASGTTADVKKALKYDRRAAKHFEKAAGLVESVQKTAPNADLSVERDYAALQLKAANAAVKCDQALLDEDSKAAKRHNAEYGKQAAAAAKLAKTLPATTDDLVESIYYSFGSGDVSVKDAQNRYEAAAKRAAKDDKMLAGLTGSGSKDSASKNHKTGSKTSKEK